MMPIKSATASHQLGVRETRDLIAELMRVWNAHDVDRALEFYAPDYEGIDVADAAPQHGPGGLRRTMERYLQAFPDLHFTEETTVIQGDHVALFWTVQGTHQGPVMNIPPTGRSIQIRGVTLLTMAAGKVTRALYIWDVAGLLRGIGLLPEL
jgi:steroid delta-isomerase-like uncharacterized protein